MSKIQLHAYILIVVLGLATLGAKSIKPLSMARPPDTNFEQVPMELEDWIGTNGKFDSKTYELLPSASLLLRYYEHGEYPITELAVVYGTDLGDFHQPEGCLEGQGLRTVSNTPVRLKDGNGGTFEAVSLITTSVDGRRAFLYWFATDGRTSTSLGYYQLRIFLDRLRGRNVRPSAMIRIGAPVEDSDKAAIGQLVHFAEAFIPYLNKEFQKE